MLAARLSSLHVSEHLAKWLAVPENSRTLAHHTATALASGARMLADEDVQELIDRVLVERIRSTQVAPLLGQMLTLITAGDRHQELLDEAIALLARAVDENQELIRDRIEAESPWWVPGMVDDRIHRKIVTGLDNTLADVRDDPNHPLRRRFDDALANFVLKLKESPEVRAQGGADEARDTRRGGRAKLLGVDLGGCEGGAVQVCGCAECVRAVVRSSVGSCRWERRCRAMRSCSRASTR